MAASEKPTQKAEKATISLGTIPLDVYQMPDGSYKLYNEAVIAVIDRPKDDLLRFLKGKSPLAKPYKDRNLLHEPMIEVEGYGGYIKPIPVELATTYWLYRATRNRKAQALVHASLSETIERRADRAFGFKRTDEEYNQIYSELVFESIWAYNREEVEDRRTPGDDDCLPPGIN